MGTIKIKWFHKSAQYFICFLSSIYLLQKGYVQPLVAVKLLLKKEDYNSELIVECKVEGSNLKNNDERDKFLGRVTFRVLVTE